MTLALIISQSISNQRQFNNDSAHQWCVQVGDASASAAFIEVAAAYEIVGNPGDPSHCTWGVERRAEISGLGPLAGCFLALGSGLGLVGTASSRR